MILVCLAIIATWAGAEWWAARAMRRRARRRRMIERYSRLEWLP
jgi:hypothetical protein